MKLKAVICFIITPLVSISILLFADLEPGNPAVTNTLAVALLMAVWWTTEAVPLAVTSLLPVALFPLLNIMNGKAVSSTYFNYIIFLFIGGFIIALAMERWNLHKRIALKILMHTGVSPAMILMGFMLATAFLSMWISNTATTMMMIPILLSVITTLEENMGKEHISKFTIGLLLGVAYSASIGGVATLVGSPPNPLFAHIFHMYFPQAPEISFTRWFTFGLPVAVVMFIIVWTFLYFVYRPAKNIRKDIDKETFRRQLKLLGPMKYEEKIVFFDFILVAVLWLFRSDLKLGSFTIPGWADLFPHPEYINDGTIAIFMAVILFILPSKKEGTMRIMNWKTAGKIPWQIVLLFGGGFALASGFKESGLSLWIGDQLKWIAHLNPIVVIFFISLLMTFLTEITSNTATTQMILPILAGIAVSSRINPLLLMLPATLSASMAFMLPVATPPNAIVFGTGKIRIAQMARAGLLLNFIGAVVITLMTYLLGMYVFDVHLHQFPEWANIK